MAMVHGASTTDGAFWTAPSTNRADDCGISACLKAPRRDGQAIKRGVPALFSAARFDAREPLNSGGLAAECGGRSVRSADVSGPDFRPKERPIHRMASALFPAGASSGDPPVPAGWTPKDGLHGLLPDSRRQPP